VREVRFIAVSNANNAALDGGVTGLFTIKGRTDARRVQPGPARLRHAAVAEPA
jgi:hypothetical protein